MTTKRFPRGLYAPELLESRIAPATFLVNSLLDDGTDGTLRKEIADANAAPGADTIVFDKALPEDAIILNTVTGEIPITGPLTIKGPGIDKLAVSGSDMIRIFKIDYTVASVVPTTISGLTLTDGKTAASGGALYSMEALTLKNVVIRSSFAGVDGGGVCVKTGGKISITGSRIVHNQATVEGGGAYLIGDAGISIVKTTLADNTSGTEGALYAGASAAGAVVLIDSCLIANNKATASDTGGLTLDADGGGKVIVKNSLITGNTAVGTGGGLTVSNDANGVVSNTTFSNNTAKNGGAIASFDAATLSITGSRFIGNRATDAATGGGALYLGGTKPVKVTGSLFSGNTSAGDGGAITAIGALAVGISGSSFLGNAAGAAGGALAVGGAAVLTMKSSVLSGNSAVDGGGALFGFNGSVVNLTANKFLENRAGAGGGALYLIANLTGAKANLSGNLFQANVAATSGGAIFDKNRVFTSKADKIIGNVALTGQGGGVYLDNSGGIFITSSLFQSNVAGSSGGGASIAGSATLTSVKVLDNIAGPGGRGGGLRISGGPVFIFKSLVTGNVANDGGGIFFNLGTTTLDAVTKVTGNAAGINQNIGSA